jgi:hypothetical protein
MPWRKRLVQQYIENLGSYAQKQRKLNAEDSKENVCY